MHPAIADCDWNALSGLGEIWTAFPRALPWAKVEPPLRGLRCKRRRSKRQRHDLVWLTAISLSIWLTLPTPLPGQYSPMCPKQPPPFATSAAELAATTDADGRNYWQCVIVSQQSTVGRANPATGVSL